MLETPYHRADTNFWSIYMLETQVQNVLEANKCDLAGLVHIACMHV